MFNVLVIIPCYNEEKNISNVVQQIEELRRSISASGDITTNICFQLDYIIVNDCSIDTTLEVCINNGFSYLDLCANLGIGGCVQAGYLYAYTRGYDVAVQLDGDGQHDPSYIEKLLLPIVRGADIVIGSRFKDKQGFQSTGMRRMGINFLSKLIQFCSGLKVLDVTSGFRAVNRKYITIFAKNYAQDYPEPEALVVAALRNAKIEEIQVVMHERKEGTSSIRAVYYMIKVSLAILLARIVAAERM